MYSQYKKYLPIIYKVLIITAIALILYFVGLPILIVMMPFILAGIIAAFMEPLVKILQKRFKFGRKISSLISLLAFLAVFGTAISYIIYKIIVELIALSFNIPNYFKQININNEMAYWSNLGNKFYLSIPPEAATVIQEKLNDTITTFSGYLTGFISSILSFILNFVKVLPQSLIFIIITIISTYFISSDKEKIKEFIFKQFPPSWESKILNLKNDLLIAIVGFIKAQLILIAVTMIIASTGLEILHMKYAITMGIIIGIAELIPIIGTGSIFVPWIVYSLITQPIHIGIGLLCIFLLGVIVRQIIEPKIIGMQVGLYPLVALVAIYVGLELFGVLGMILGPLLVILLKNLNGSGIIRLWKE